MRSTFQLFLFGLAMALMAPRAHSAEIPCKNIAAGTTLDVLADLGAIASNAILSASRKTTWSGPIMLGQLEKAEGLLDLAIARVKDSAPLMIVLQKVKVALIFNETADDYVPHWTVNENFWPIKEVVEKTMTRSEVLDDLAAQVNAELAGETGKGNEHLANALRQVKLTKRKMLDEMLHPPKVPRGTNESWAALSRLEGHIDENLSAVNQALVNAKTVQGIYALKRAKTNLEFHKSVVVRGQRFDFLHLTPIFDFLFDDIFAAVQAEGI